MTAICADQARRHLRLMAYSHSSSGLVCWLEPQTFTSNMRLAIQRDCLMLELWGAAAARAFGAELVPATGPLPTAVTCPLTNAQA